MHNHFYGAFLDFTSPCQGLISELRTRTWRLLSGTGSLFITVLLFMAMKKCLGALREEVACGDWWERPGVSNVCWWIFHKVFVLLFAFPFGWQKEQQEKRRWCSNLEVVGVIGWMCLCSFFDSELASAMQPLSC